MLKIDTYQAFKAQVMEPDFQDFMEDRGSLRKAWHCAGSLFHLHDWIYKTHAATINAKYTFVNDDGNERPVRKSSEFATALGQIYPEFQIIRGVANSSKHFVLGPVPEGRINPPGTPSNAANTYVVSAGFQPGPFQDDAFETDGVWLEAEPEPVEFAPLAQKVLKMWDSLIVEEGW